MQKKFDALLDSGDVTRRRVSLLQRVHLDGWLLLLILLIGSVGLFILY